MRGMENEWKIEMNARRMRMEGNGWKEGKNWDGLFPSSSDSTFLFIDSSFQTLTSLSK